MEPILVNCNHCKNLIETEYGLSEVVCHYYHTPLEITELGRSIYTKIKTTTSPEIN